MYIWLFRVYPSTILPLIFHRSGTCPAVAHGVGTAVAGMLGDLPRVEGGRTQETPEAVRLCPPAGFQQWNWSLGAKGAGVSGAGRGSDEKETRRRGEPREQGRGINRRSVGAGRPIHIWDYPRGHPAPALPFVIRPLASAKRDASAWQARRPFTSAPISGNPSAMHSVPNPPTLAA